MIRLENLRWYKLPVKKPTKITIVGQIVDNKIEQTKSLGGKKYVALIDNELWILPNHKILRDCIARYGTGTEMIIERRNKGIYQKVKVKYNFKMITEVSKNKARKTINKIGEENVVSAIKDRSFYKELNPSKSNNFIQDLIVELS